MIKIGRLERYKRTLKKYHSGNVILDEVWGITLIKLLLIKKDVGNLDTLVISYF